MHSVNLGKINKQLFLGCVLAIPNPQLPQSGSMSTVPKAAAVHALSTLPTGYSTKVYNIDAMISWGSFIRTNQFFSVSYCNTAFAIMQCYSYHWLHREAKVAFFV